MKHEHATKGKITIAAIMFSAALLFGMISNLYGYHVQRATAAGTTAVTDQNSSVVPTGMATKSSGVTPMPKNNTKAVNSKRISMPKTNWINNIVRGINRR
jgi:hypothetical protein